MKIYSKFRDFYDVMQKYHSDDLVFNRIQSTREIKVAYDYNNRVPDGGRFIGFCGKVYPFIYHQAEYNVNKFFYSIDEYEKYFYPKGYSKDYCAKNSWRSNNQKQLEAFFDKDYKPFFDEPIYYLNNDRRRTWRVAINPRLQDYEFYRVMDNYTAFQELQMWIGNHIPEKPIPQIDDKTMAEAKGFNKYSFRKEKSK